MLALLACVLFQVAGVKDWTQLSRPDPSTGTFCLDERRDRWRRMWQRIGADDAAAWCKSFLTVLDA